MSDARRRAWPMSTWLNLVGAAVVTGFAAQQVVTGQVLWPVFAVAMVAVLGWVAIVPLPDRAVRTGQVVMVLTILAAAVVAAPTNGLLIVPIIVTLLRAARLWQPAWFSPLLALLAAGVIPVGALLTPITVPGILSLEAGVLIGLLGGLTRRQARQAERHHRELLERTAAMREEQARVCVLAARQSLARDMHDVLAHSLGGLVVQLDAVEALLEAGRVEPALARVSEARALAAAGLGEARRAVEALRAEPGDEPDVAVSEQVRELVDAHRRLGGTVTFTEHGVPQAVSADAGTAVRRATQESLSNARKHAPSVPVDVVLDWRPESLTLRVSNPLVPRAGPSSVSASGELTLGELTVGGLAATGGGNGLRGMAERFAQLAGGHLEAGARKDEFVVIAEVHR